MSVSLYFDVHIPRAVTVALRLRGVDILTAQQDGTADWDDGPLLERATKLGRVFVSQDADLLREASIRPNDFCGVVYAHQLRITIGEFVEDLELIAKATGLEEWRGRIEYLPIR